MKIARQSLALSIAALSLSHMAAAQGTPSSLDPAMYRLWGGETRQVFHLDLDNGAGGTERHVWTVGDGALIRHAVDPDATTTWEVQQPPSDVTQNLLDIHFIPGDGGPNDPDHVGYACGVNGNVLTTIDYGQTWTHFDQVNIPNLAPGSDHATLWRTRFADEDTGFTCGLWTFLGWDSTTSQWDEVTLKSGPTSTFPPGVFEFYSLELIVDPADSSNWIGLAAGQLWGLAGDNNSSPRLGVVFQGSSAVDGGMTWTEVFRTTAGSHSGQSQLQDPWDIECAPNPASIAAATVYMCCGRGIGMGAVYRSDDSGQTWAASLSNASAPAGHSVTTLYGLTAIDEEQVVAAGYGGQVWFRDSTGVWHQRRGIGAINNPDPVDDRSGPLAGVHGDAAGVYVTGSWGYVDHSTDGYATTSTRLNSAGSEFQNEHWRLSDVHFSSATHGHAVGSKKVIVETNDGGNSWDYANGAPNTDPTASGRNLEAVSFSDSGATGVAVGYGDVAGLSTWSGPTLVHTFAYSSMTPGNWLIGDPVFPVNDLKSIDLKEVDWVDGEGSNAEFWAVGTKTHTSQVTQPALLRTVNGGGDWTDANSLGTIPSTVSLTGIAFRSTTLGLAVGYERSPSLRPVAYSIDLSGATPTVTEILVQATGGAVATGISLTAIDSNSAISIAVGEDESLFNFVASVPKFVQIGNLPALGFATPTDFQAVAVPPGNDVRVLVSAVQSEDEVDSPGVGKMLYYRNGWQIINAASNKHLVSLNLRQGKGWGIAFTVDTTSENGTVADSAVLGFHDPVMQQ